MMPKERLQRTLSGRIADRAPALPMVAGDHAALLAGAPLHQIFEAGEALGRVLVAAYRHYEPDGIIVFSDVAVEAEAIGAELEFPQDGVPFVVGPPVNMQIPDPWCAGRMPLMLEATRVCLEAVGDDALVFASIKGPFSLAALISEPEEFFSSLLINPERVHETLEFATQVQLRYIDAISELGDVALFVGDPFATGELIGPRYYEAFALPYCKRLMDHIHAKGLLAVLHICGDTTCLLPLIPETGADGFSVDEINLGQAQQALKGKVVLMGNVSTSLLRDRSAPEVRKAALSCLRQTQGHPFILSSACDIPAATPEGNVFALIDAAKHWSTRDERKTLNRKD